MNGKVCSQLSGFQWNLKKYLFVETGFVDSFILFFCKLCSDDVCCRASTDMKKSIIDGSLVIEVRILFYICCVEVYSLLEYSHDAMWFCFVVLVRTFASITSSSLCKHTICCLASQSCID